VVIVAQTAKTNAPHVPAPTRDAKKPLKYGQKGQQSGASHAADVFPRVFWRVDRIVRGGPCRRSRRESAPARIRIDSDSTLLCTSELVVSGQTKARPWLKNAKMLQ
jgi:hypothetical protein